MKTRKMNVDEKITYTYLCNFYGEKKTIFEPDGNCPPDFLVDSNIAIEVRRLNENYFSIENVEGLEIKASGIYNSFVTILRSFDTAYSGQTYCVSIGFQRPIITKQSITKKLIKNALNEFLISPQKLLPHVISIDEQMEIRIYVNSPKEGKVFVPAGEEDDDSGGEPISIYTKNIKHCISEKSHKISKFKNKYFEWWLILVDNIFFDPGNSEISQIIKNIPNTGNFSKILIIDILGKNVIGEIHGPNR